MCYLKHIIFHLIYSTKVRCDDAERLRGRVTGDCCLFGCDCLNSVSSADRSRICWLLHFSVCWFVVWRGFSTRGVSLWCCRSIGTAGPSAGQQLCLFRPVWWLAWREAGSEAISLLTAGTEDDTMLYSTQTRQTGMQAVQKRGNKKSLYYYSLVN